MLNLVDIIENLIKEINLTVTVREVVGVQLFVCNTTKHLTLGKIVTDGIGQEYKVTAIVVNSYVELEPYLHAVPFTGTEINGPSIEFLHGTPQSTNQEYLNLGQMTLDKTPFIWLLENYEFEDMPRDSSIENSYTTRLFFFDWSNDKVFSNKQINDFVIKPMENLKDMFFEVVDNDFLIKRVQGKTIIPRPRFGVTISDKGNTKKIINADLSGVEARFQLEHYFSLKCEC